VLTFALAALTLTAAPQAPKTPPPPGMVFIPGGTTWIGTDPSEVMKAAEDNTARFTNLACETPLFQRNVDGFFLGVTEITNEQFAEYVKATGARPPDSWGKKAIEEAGQRYSEEIGLKKKEARDAGKPVPELPKFDAVQWWNDHWKDATWELPAGQHTFPVGYVDFREAENYARWAGVRLMTEFEYQRAARGSTKHSYPWGEKWDPNQCAHGGLGLKTAKPVGSYPGGKTAQGIWDLSGNVWEWTSSPFLEYPGFKVLEVKRGKEKLSAVVAWSGGQRVVVGGSYATDNINAARISTRRPTNLDQSAEAMGFRIAASTIPGADIAAALMHQGMEHLPADIKFDETKTVVCDRWTTAKGTSEVPDYGVITGYDYVVFVPATGLEFTSLGQLDQATQDKAPVHMGVLASSKPIFHPELPAGTYTVTMRGPGPLKRHESIQNAPVAEVPAVPVVPANGKQGMVLQDEKPKQDDKDKEKEKEKPVAQPIVFPEGFEPDKRNLMFLDSNHAIVGVLSIENPEFITPKPTSVTIGPKVLDLSKPGAPLQISVTGVGLKVNTWVKVSNKGLHYTIPLSFKVGDVTPDWRH